MIIRTAREYGSLNPNHRSALRQELQSTVRSEAHKRGLFISPDDVERLIDLSAPPRLAACGISVSHCPELGGFAIDFDAAWIGFDVEVTSRLTSKVIERIAHFSTELTHIKNLREQAPLLWVAKEAAIKAYGNAFPDQAPHIGDVEIVTLDLKQMRFTTRRNGIHGAGQFLDMNGETTASTLVAAISTVDRAISNVSI